MTIISGNPIPEAEVVATIANGQSVSSVVDLRAVPPRGLAIRVPYTLTSSTDLIFFVGRNDGNWYLLRDKNGSALRVVGVATSAGVTGLPSDMTLAGDVYTLPSEAWSVAAYSHLRVACVATGGLTLQAQSSGDTLYIVCLS